MLKGIVQKGIFTGLMLLLSIGFVLAQSNCPELVQEALLAVDENCNVAGRNEACYGYDQVEASFLSSVEDNFFTEPASIAAIADLETIRTAPLNTETGVWGVAVMNIQADLPNTIPGQSVTFILLGDVEVENAVAPDEAFVPSEGVEVTVNSPSGANVRSGPGTNFNVLGGLRDAETVLADGLSQDGQWLRVAYRERPAWLNLSVIDDSNPALRDLPILSADLQTPMQAFYLRTGIGEPECNEAPEDGLLVQGPENIEINLSINGANIRLGSTGFFEIVEEGEAKLLQLSVIDGEFQIGDTIIRRGQRTRICLGDENSRGLDGENNDLVVTCDPSTPEPYDGADLCNLEALPTALLNYQVDVPCPGETPPPANNTGGNTSSSQIAGVNCSGFSILTTEIPATTFVLSWSPAAGADSYEVAIFDTTGFQTSVHSGLSETSIGLNGGVGIASAGYIDVRAYQAGQYACYTRLNFTRLPDPNEGLPDGPNLAARLSCSRGIATVSYSGGGGNTITATANVSGVSSSQSSTAGRGSFTFRGRVIAAVTVTSSNGETINLGDC